MEKQEFLMEICEISNGAGGDEKLKNATIELIKAAIKQQASNGVRQYSISPRLNAHGVAITLPVAAALDYFREQGFNVAQQNGVSWIISW